MSANLSQLFEKEPGQFGLRGDPLLWKAMELHLAGREADTPEELGAAVREAFETLTGRPWTEPDHFFCENFNGRQGMSSGMIAPAFWREKALPLLEKRLAAASKSFLDKGFFKF